MLEAIIMGLTMGLAGSVHCIGMCGPLALALPLNSTTGLKRFLSALAYNTGRTVTYFSMGAILGWTGSRLVAIGYQQLFSIAMGALILLILLLGKYLPSIKILSAFQVSFKKYVARFLNRKPSIQGLFIFGLLNGLLPCGLVYMAIASALIIGGPLQSGIFMAAFGLGTIPLMLILMITGHLVSFSLRSTMKKPYLISSAS
ncbi:sulfite exporter TauE/SafE family protein [Niabella hibiscisoli]|uniref:sulfite exporter TauE/SafE family protein n=1 Tax=Niabella hibiscisoli TaxID=1825928 RepID=UPI001F117D03|nr:sulfite exporter TauE/SafE family protein [Niabella hibiscisoli]MCH5720931.1 sulfite exporter TauE/SafE family protein [Niabella hibiscisoli]